MSDNDQRSAEIEEHKTNGDKKESLSSLKRSLDDSEDSINEQPQEKKIAFEDESEVASEQIDTNTEEETFASRTSEAEKSDPENSSSSELKTELKPLDDNSLEDISSEAVELTAKPDDHPLNSEPNSPASMGSSGAINDIIDVPDRMVGLIIGKGGEQISNIQSQSGARVQFAPDSEGRASRTCSLSGTPEAIQRAKEIIQRIIEKGQGLPDSIQMDNGVTMIEMSIPGHKAGLVIGKSGETIKQLQERAGVKMVLIQDSNQATFQDKPLRITGPPDRCQKAKEMIMELLAKKDAENASFGSSEFGNRTTIEVMTPRSLVGIIIGKNGDMIKKITNETSCRIQFKPDDGQLAERACMVMGPVEGATRAAHMVQELIDKNMDKIDMRPPNKSGGGGGGGGGRSHDNYDRGGGQQGAYGNSYTTESTFVIPADKCGLVIGKGGDTIREINRVSGGFVELARQQNQNSNERVFNVRGTPDQIQHAVRMICEKAGLPPPPAGGPGSRPSQGGPMGGGPMGFDQFGQFGQQFGGQPGLAPQQAGVPQQFPGYANYGAATPATSSWPGFQQPTTWAQPAQPDPNKQSSDPWAAYYAAFYAQQQQVQPQALAPQPAVQQPAPVQQIAAQPAQQSAASGYPQPTINPQTGQLDYSAAWAEYYRQQGMYSHAQAVLSGTPGAGPQQPR